MNISWMAAPMLALALPLGAAEFTLGDGIQGTFHGNFSYGSSWRTEDPDPGLLGSLAAKRVPGTPPGLMPGPNAGGSDLNFYKNAAVSTVLKGVADVELRRGNLGLFVRAKAWQDYALTDGNRPYGNFPNGYTAGIPLSDNGFDPEARFANVQFDDVYAFTSLDVGAGAPVDLKVGRQFLNWGTAKMVGGGVNMINPINQAGASRPGALPEESRLPVGMLTTTWQASKQWAAQAFVQYEFRPNVYAGCGTFYQSTNLVPVGCNYQTVLPAAAGGGNDPTQWANGRYAHRGADIPASDSGQFGLSLHLKPEEMSTDFYLYAMNLHSRVPSVRITNANIAGTPGNYGTLAQPAVNRLTDPNGLKYALVYPENIQVLGVGFESKLNPGALAFGELTHRPNQPLNLSGPDGIAAFLQRAPNSALNLAKGTNAIPAGGSFDGYDRYAVTNLSLGISQGFAGLWGAQRLVLSGEVGLSSIDGLPSADRLRYGRSEEYSTAALPGQACAGGSLACSVDGFVTSSAWGYRLRAAATYASSWLGASVTPSLYFAQDVRGYSFDGTYSEGRRILRPGLRLEWGAHYFAEVNYNMVMGGLYNNLSDRDTLTLFAGTRF